MRIIRHSVVVAALVLSPTTALWAQNSDPGKLSEGNVTVATPTYGKELGYDPALTTGSRYSVRPNTPAQDNPTVAGATGEAIVKGDSSTISGDRRATFEQKTGGAASDAPGG